jgi:fermentation-respiration switch protein FrsA (DUF1100 family)
MTQGRRILPAIVIVALVAGIGYTGYVGFEGSRQAVGAPDDTNPDCRTPDLVYGWSYEAINYDKADDAALQARNEDLTHCSSLGAKAGDAVVTDDGIHIGGWYIPAGDGSGPTADTVILVHGHSNTKQGMLKYGVSLHESFNLVAFDLRNYGRSTGSATTYGVLEQQDLRAIIDWLERTKHPTHIGVLGLSLGAGTALAEAVGDPRVDALVLDSMHTRIRYQFEQRLVHSGHPAYPGTWAIFVGTWIRTGLDVGSVDAEDQIARMRDRPVLLAHGTADDEDLPYRTAALYQQAVRAGVRVELNMCEGSGHGADGMPVEVCTEAYGGWVLDFFTRSFAAAPG